MNETPRASGHFAALGSERWPQRRVIGACGVTGCDSHCWCCGDTLEQALTVTDREARNCGKLGFCCCVHQLGGCLRCLRVLSSNEFLGSDRSQPDLFHMGRKRQLQTAHTPLWLQRPSRNVSRGFHFTVTSYSDYPTSAFFVLSLTQIAYGETILALE